MIDLYNLIQELHAEKQRLDRVIATLEGMLPDTVKPAQAPPKRRGRTSMNDQERREVSQRMKTYWASRRERGGG